MSGLSLKELNNMPERLASGHRLCAGCGESIIARQILMGTDKDVAVTVSTGCFEVSTTIFPYTSWRVPMVHTAFANGAAACAGLETAYRSLKRQGKTDKDIRFVNFAGDGATYDIGLQSLSGAMERGHNMLFVCFTNEAYMNTGIQRSGATPRGANTTTSPVGEVLQGKTQWRKPFTRIMAAHEIPYVAQTAPHNYRDLMTKVKKAFAADGPAVLNIMAPCPRGWRHESDQALNITQLAADTCYWPLYEVENGKTTVNYKPREKLPVADWLKTQGRFRHLFRPANQGLLQEIQDKTDQEWERLLKEEEAGL
jgi:pyruvate ferredoxin oxidoreductase beta subunit